MEQFFSTDNFDYSSFNFKPLARKPGENGTVVYADCVCSFDIETTRIEEREQSIMYVWQFAIEETVIYGRTWDEFKTFLHKLKEKLGTMHLIIFVHNLSFEIQFLAGIYNFNDYEVFCTESRKVLKAVMYKNFEFRCSYKLTNLSLAAMTKRYNKKYLKQSGEEFDYSKRRFPDTPLSETELKYCFYDVLGVVESIHEILRLNDESLYSLPLTATGFVRKAVKTAMIDYRQQMLKDIPPYRCYQLLRSAFRGGNTHANRFYVDCILDNVTSVDISSSYPSQQVNKKFPVGVWKERHDLSISQLDKRIELGAAVIMRVYLYDVELRNPYVPIPYIPIAKCIRVKYPDDYRRGLCVDNGRIIQADFLEMCITDIDYRLIVSMYNFRMEIQELWSNWYDFLPLPIRSCNLDYFRQKTMLKGIAGQELYYLKNKELLNSIYGMSVQDPVKRTISFADLKYIEDDTKSGEELYNTKRKNAFTQYCFGVWTTAHARESLQAGIDICGDSIVYVDTDSCKYLGSADFSKYNNDRIAECKASGAFADDPHGVTHYLGVYETDGVYKRFVTQGAKKYAYEDQAGKLHITVSGVSKKRGAEELTRRGGLEAFKPGFIFHDSGKTESVYNDNKKPVITNVDGHLITITRNVVIRETTYTLGYDSQGFYADLLNVSSNSLNKVHKFWRNLQLK
ncbi:MAG: hypothetical protein J6V49_02840 [Bacteroidales bacterium]|nr:hypothetical protein [Bacteroidales bacterium]